MTERITIEDLKGRKGTNAVHFDTSTHAVWRFLVDGIPRLGVEDSYERRSQKTARTWFADGEEMPDLETALAVINGEKSIEEVKAMVQFAPPAVRPKLSLIGQIGEIDYELKQRDRVYKDIIARDPSRRAELELHVENMKAVRATLIWLQDNEDRIKQRFSY